MNQVLVNVDTLEKTARLAELAAANDEKLTKVAAEHDNFATKLVPEIVDAMIKQGVLDSRQREKAAKELATGDFTKIAHTMIFLTSKIGAPSMGTVAAEPGETSKIASESVDQSSADKFRLAILGR